MRPAAAAVLTLVLGCSSSPPTGGGVTASAPPPTPGASVPSPAPPTSGTSGDPASLVGLWTSPRCGERSYERRLDLIAGGRFVAHDRVSPCPPGAQCVWSGIVSREGSWSVAGHTMTLTVEKDGKGPKASALPAQLDVAGGALSEGPGEGCAYTRR